MEYEVVIYETVAHRATVEATNPDEAYEKAYEIITNGKTDDYETEAIGFTGEFDIYEIARLANGN